MIPLIKMIELMDSWEGFPAPGHLHGMSGQKKGLETQGIELPWGHPVEARVIVIRRLGGISSLQ